LRSKMINHKHIDSMVHLGTRAFEEIGGEVVQTTAFVLRNRMIENVQGTYFRLVDFTHSTEKKKAFLKALQEKSVPYKFTFNQHQFNKIPGSPIAYWVSNEFIANFEKGISINDISSYTGSQNKTANNKKF